MDIKKLAEQFKFYRRFGKSGWNIYRDEHQSDKPIIEFRNRELKHPLFLRRKTSDFDVFKQVIYNQEYKIHTGFDAEYIIDAGGNIGLASVHFKNRFPNAKIICVEPESGNFEMVQKNTKPYPNIIPVKAGVWNKTTYLKIIDSSVASWGFMVKETAADDPTALPAVSIGDLMRTYHFPRIDILKMDIEGSEKEVFEENYDEWLSKTRILLVETHDGMRKNAAKTLFRALDKYDYQLGTSGENLLIYLNN